MKDIRVKEMMVLLSEYATVSENASLYEAVQALEEAQRRRNQNISYKHRSVSWAYLIYTPVHGSIHYPPDILPKSSERD